MSAVRVPVLIVGAGAAGLSTSALLAKHGVSSLLVEKRREIFIYPKARNLSFRSLEILRGLGLGDQVHGRWCPPWAGRWRPARICCG